MIRINNFLLLVLLCTSCTKTTIIKVESNENSGRRAVEVAYYVPQYNQPNQGVLKSELGEAIPLEDTGKIIYFNNHIFINKPQEGIHILDNTDPNNPINQSFLTLKGSIDLAIIDGFLYVDQFSALVVLDIRDLNAIQLIDDFTVLDIFNYDPFWAYEPLNEANQYEYIRFDPIDYSKGIVTGWELDIRWETIDPYWYDYFPLASQEDGFVELEGDSEVSVVSQAGSMARFLPIDNLLYTLNNWELILFEIDENHQPLRFGKTPTNTMAETLYKLNDLLFIGTTTGMQLYDISDASNPQFLSQIDHFRSCDPVVADTEYAYVTLRGGTNCFTDRNELQIISLEDPKELEVVSRQLLFNPHGLAIHENFLLVCDGTAGIKVVDVKDKENPMVVNTYPVNFAYDVIIDFPRAMVVGEGKLYQYDISQLPEMVLISE